MQALHQRYLLYRSSSLSKSVRGFVRYTARPGGLDLANAEATQINDDIPEFYGAFAVRMGDD